LRWLDGLLRRIGKWFKSGEVGLEFEATCASCDGGKATPKAKRHEHIYLYHEWQNDRRRDAAG
jgi:hypothetical protein